MRAPQVVELPVVPGPDLALSCVLLQSASGGPQGFSQSYRGDRNSASLPHYSFFDLPWIEAGAGFDRLLQKGVVWGRSPVRALERGGIGGIG